MNDNEKNKENSFEIPQYPQNYNCEPVDSSPSQILAIVSLATSIAGILCCWGFLGALLSITAVITGIISLHKNETRGFAVSGLVIGIIGIIISAVTFVFKILSMADILTNISGSFLSNI